MIKVGQKVYFDPTSTWMGYGVECCRGKVSGTVVMVNHKNGWFSVKYGDLRTSFMFSQIGREVKVCGK